MTQPFFNLVLSWYVVVLLKQHIENMYFSQFSPSAGFMAEAFCWLFPWSVKEKVSTIFYDIAFNYC